MNGGHVFGIATTATDVAVHSRNDVGIGRLWNVLQQGHGAHNHSGGAITALERAFIHERLLHGMKFIAVGQSFDREDRLFVGISNGRGAGSDAFAVHQDGASSALAFAAAVFCAGELQILAEHVEQGPFGIGRDGPGFAVDGKCDGRVHKGSNVGYPL